jgi:hypothetical protein
VPDEPENSPENQPADPNTVTITVPAQNSTNTTAGYVQPAVQTTTPRQARSGSEPSTFSPEDVERIRTEERERYQAQLTRADELQTELAKYRQSEEERVKAEDKLRKEAEKADKKKAEEEMELRDLIAKKDAEWEVKLAEERAEREKALAVLDQERRFAGLQGYLSQRMMTDGERIAPQLRRLVAGNSEQEIDASINNLIQITDEIAGETSQVLQQQSASRRTVGVTAPPMGPIDMTPQTRTLSADDIKNMTTDEYAALREGPNGLMAAAAQAYRNR